MSLEEPTPLEVLDMLEQWFDETKVRLLASHRDGIMRGYCPRFLLISEGGEVFEGREITARRLVTSFSQDEAPELVLAMLSPIYEELALGGSRLRRVDEFRFPITPRTGGAG